MKTYRNLYPSLCSKENIYSAYLKARKHKTLKQYVIDFEQNLNGNLEQLCQELNTQTYQPRQLTTFIVRDPKTRRINASDFRDRIVHHALINTIGPIFEARFIHDSFANQKNKGTHKAILRYEKFLRKLPHSHALKADIKSYFDNVDHQILLSIISRRIKDEKVLWLIRTILANHKGEIQGKGMPIGNLTRQFFADVYLNELDKLPDNQKRKLWRISGAGVRPVARYDNNFNNNRRNVNANNRHDNRLGVALVSKKK